MCVCVLTFFFFFINTYLNCRVINHLHGLIFELKERMNSRQDRPVMIWIYIVYILFFFFIEWMPSSNNSYVCDKLNNSLLSRQELNILNIYVRWIYLCTNIFTASHNVCAMLCVFFICAYEEIVCCFYFKQRPSNNAYNGENCHNLFSHWLCITQY